MQIDGRNETAGPQPWSPKGAAIDLARCLRFYSRLPVPALPFEAHPHALPDFRSMAPLVPLAGLALGLVPALVLLLALGLGLGPFLAAALAVAGFVGAAQAQSQSPAMERIEKQKQLRVGWAVWHPYVYRDPKSNQVQGISYELLQDMGKALGVNVVWVEDNWSTLPAGIQANKFEITNLMAITPPRAEVVGFSEAVTQHGLSLLAPQAEVAKTRSWQDWDKPGIKIAVTLGANSDMFVTEKFKKAEIVRLKTVPENVLALVSGRVHAHASTIDALMTIQKEHKTLPDVGASPEVDKVAFALPKGAVSDPIRTNDGTVIVHVVDREDQLLTKYGLDASFAAK